MARNSAWALIIRLGLVPVILAVVVVLFVVGRDRVTSDVPASATATADTAPIVLPMPTISPEAWSSRGRIEEDGPLDSLSSEIGDVLGNARRAVYGSVSAVNGSGTEVTGTFFLPRGKAPEAGWPVVALAHGTTGINNDCGPSTASDLMGFLPAVKSFLAGGYAVAFTDYEGLGHPGDHPYLEPRTAAFNVIDSVRVVRQLFPDVSPRWMAFGTSQGGQAAWAADELNAFYGDGLNLVGSVALSPAANISGLADLTSTGSLSAEQRALLPLVVVGLARYTVGFDPGSILHGRTEAEKDSLVGCGPEAGKLRASGITPKDLRPDNAQQVDVFREALRKIALPQGPLGVPMLVINGVRDESIWPQWVSSAVARSCQLGGQIEHFEIPDAGHADLGVGASEAVSKWMIDRFAGTPAPSNCAEQP